MKKCFKCGDVKSLDDFYQHKQMSDGRLGKCKECTRRDVRERRESNIEKHRRYDSDRNKQPSRIAKRKEYLKRYRSAHREAGHAHNAVARAIKSGTITKCPCEVCGITENIHAHHGDYSKPLDVNWLCAFHHVQLHEAERS